MECEYWLAVGNALPNAWCNVNVCMLWLGVLLGEWTKYICCMWLVHSHINNIILNGNLSDLADGV